MRKLFVYIVLGISSTLFSNVPPVSPAQVVETPAITVEAAIPLAIPIATAVPVVALTNNNSAQSLNVLAINRRASLPSILQPIAISTAPIAIRQVRSVSMTQRSPSSTLPSPGTPYKASHSMSPPVRSPILRPMGTSPQSPPTNLNLEPDQPPRTVNIKTFTLLIRELKPVISGASAAVNKVGKEINAMHEKTPFLDRIQKDNVAKLKQSLEDAMACLSSLDANRKAKAEDE